MLSIIFLSVTTLFAEETNSPSCGPTWAQNSSTRLEMMDRGGKGQALNYYTWDTQANKWELMFYNTTHATGKGLKIAGYGTGFSALPKEIRTIEEDKNRILQYSLEWSESVPELAQPIKLQFEVILLEDTRFARVDLIGANPPETGMSNFLRLPYKNAYYSMCVPNRPNATIRPMVDGVYKKGLRSVYFQQFCALYDSKRGSIIAFLKLPSTNSQSRINCTGSLFNGVAFLEPPVYLYAERIEKGMSEEEVVSYLENIYQILEQGPPYNNLKGVVDKDEY